MHTYTVIRSYCVTFAWYLQSRDKAKRMTYAPSSNSTPHTVLSIWAAEVAEKNFRYGVRIN